MDERLKAIIAGDSIPFQIYLFERPELPLRAEARASGMKLHPQYARNSPIRFILTEICCNTLMTTEVTAGVLNLRRSLMTVHLV
jgi:hypothetical protein